MKWHMLNGRNGTVGCPPGCGGELYGDDTYDGGISSNGDGGISINGEMAATAALRAHFGCVLK